MNTRFVNAAKLGMLLGALACAGCTKSLPPASDVTEARTAMETALDTWQRGESPQTLTARTPPIQFSDFNWAKGLRLVKYQIANQQPHGLALRLTVKLSLESKDGQRRDATTVYLAETQPRIIIVPEF